MSSLDENQPSPQLAACRASPSLLPHTQHNAGTHLFWGFDEESRYKHNLKTKPQDWPYRTKHIDYAINSLGYRAPEFDTVDWANVIAVFGCSFVFGDGLGHEETISQRIEQMTDVTTINLGAGGSGIVWNLHNQLLLATHYPTPRAVVCLWPSINRDQQYEHADHVCRSGPWNMSKDSSADHWNRGTNPATQAWMNRQLAKNLWAHKCPFVDATLLRSTHWATDCELVADNWGEWATTARDGVHPGPQVSQKIAEGFVSHLSREAVAAQKF
jgi:hypothetical protein